MLRQLQNLMRAIDEGAEDIEMASAEGVFDKSLSRVLRRRAGQLQRTAKDLNALLRSVARAHIPMGS